MKNQDIINQLTQAFKKEMGLACFNAQYSTSFINSISLKFGIQERKNHANGYFVNDPSRHTISIYGFDDEGNSTNDMELSIGSGGSIAVNPPKDSHLCFGRVKIGFRQKKKATAEQIIKNLTNYFKKLRKVVNENRENISCEVV